MFVYSKCKGSLPLCVIPIEDILAVERLQEESFKMKYVSWDYRIHKDESVWKLVWSPSSSVD